MTKFIQRVSGKFLYYARALDGTMLQALNNISSKQSKPTENTLRATIKFLNYAATHPDAKVQYRASDMILHIINDASYGSLPESRSCVAGDFFLNG